MWEMFFQYNLSVWCFHFRPLSLSLQGTWVSRTASWRQAYGTWRSWSVWHRVSHMSSIFLISSRKYQHFIETKKAFIINPSNHPNSYIQIKSPKNLQITQILILLNSQHCYSSLQCHMIDADLLLKKLLLLLSMLMSIKQFCCFILLWKPRKSLFLTFLSFCNLLWFLLFLNLTWRKIVLCCRENKDEWCHWLIRLISVCI